MRTAAEEFVNKIRHATYKQRFFQMLASAVITPVAKMKEKLYHDLLKTEARIRHMEADLQHKHLTGLERSSLLMEIKKGKARKERLTGTFQLN